MDVFSISILFWYLESPFQKVFHKYVNILYNNADLFKWK